MSEKQSEYISKRIFTRNQHVLSKFEFFHKKSKFMSKVKKYVKIYVCFLPEIESFGKKSGLKIRNIMAHNSTSNKLTSCEN